MATAVTGTAKWTTLKGSGYNMVTLTPHLFFSIERQTKSWKSCIILIFKIRFLTANFYSEFGIQILNLKLNKLINRRFNQNVDYDLEFLTKMLLLKNEFIKIGV